MENKRRAKWEQKRKKGKRKEREQIEGRVTVQ